MQQSLPFSNCSCSLRFNCIGANGYKAIAIAMANIFPIYLFPLSLSLFVPLFPLFFLLFFSLHKPLESLLYTSIFFNCVLEILNRRDIYLPQRIKKRFVWFFFHSSRERFFLENWVPVFCLWLRFDIRKILEKIVFFDLILEATNIFHEIPTILLAKIRKIYRHFSLASEST